MPKAKIQSKKSKLEKATSIERPIKQIVQVDNEVSCEACNDTIPSGEEAVHYDMETEKHYCKSCHEKSAICDYCNNWIKHKGKRPYYSRVNTYFVNCPLGTAPELQTDTACSSVVYCSKTCYVDSMKTRWNEKERKLVYIGKSCLIPCSSDQTSFATYDELEPEIRESYDRVDSNLYEVRTRKRKSQQKRLEIVYLPPLGVEKQIRHFFIHTCARYVSHAVTRDLTVRLYLLGIVNQMKSQGMESVQLTLKNLYMKKVDVKDLQGSQGKRSYTYCEVSKVKDKCTYKVASLEKSVMDA